MHPSDIWEARKYTCVYVRLFGTRMAMIDTLLITIEQQARDRGTKRERQRQRGRKKGDDEWTEEGQEKHHVKKPSSFVC